MKTLFALLATLALVWPAHSQTSSFSLPQVVGEKTDRGPFTPRPTGPAHLQYSTAGEVTVTASPPAPAFGAIVDSPRSLYFAWDAPDPGEAERKAMELCTARGNSPASCTFKRLFGRGQCAAVYAYATGTDTNYTLHHGFVVGNGPQTSQDLALDTCRTTNPNSAYTCRVPEDNGKPQTYCQE